MNQTRHRNDRGVRPQVRVAQHTKPRVSHNSFDQTAKEHNSARSLLNRALQFSQEEFQPRFFLRRSRADLLGESFFQNPGAFCLDHRT